MHHEAHEAHEASKNLQHWSGGVLEYWAFKVRLLHHSNTPLLPPLKNPPNLRVLRVLCGEVILAVTMLVCVTGCMLGPNYQRPSVTTPASFRGTTTIDAQSIADLKWFEVFKDE